MVAIQQGEATYAPGRRNERPSDNRFHFGTPVPLDEKAFTGRATEIDTLAALMRNHLSAVLLSPRRYGKTGLANHASVRRGLGRLLEDQLVDTRCGELVVTDPFFATWLRCR